MPYHTSWQSKWIYRRYWGILSLREVLQANERFFSDKRSLAITCQLWNFLDVEEIDLDEMDLMHVAAIHFGGSKYLKKMRIAFVVNDENRRQIAEHYMKISKDLGSRWEYRIFFSLSEAQDWLQIAKPD